MLFVYPKFAHVRRHGPFGYSDYRNYKPWLRDEFHFRCVYCLERERWYPSGHDAFGVDHVKPKGDVKYRYLVCNYDNLVYSCNRCNSAKSDALLIDPCSFPLAGHVRVYDNGKIEGLTTEGKDIVDILGLDLEVPTLTRRRYLRILQLYADYPNDPQVEWHYHDAFGFPADLPVLSKLKPKGNERPDGLTSAYHAQAQLPRVYLA